MNIESNKFSWLSLALLWLSYSLLGWYLSAYHVFWLMGALIAALPLAIAWRSIPCLEDLVRFGSRGFRVILIMLVVSILISLITTWSLLVPLMLVPLITTFLAGLEMRFAGFGETSTFLLLIVLAGLGLGLGEIVDIMISPSMRY